MTRRQILFVVALAISAWLAVFGDKTSSGGIAEPIAHTPISNTALSEPNNALQSAALKVDEASQPLDATTQKAEKEIVILALRSREEFMGSSVSSKYVDELFASQNWTPPPPPPAILLPSPPVPPPLPFTYIGKKMEDMVWEVYLARGDQTLVVGEQTTIDGTYRVESIKPPSLVLAYLPLNKMQTINIGGAD